LSVKSQNIVNLHQKQSRLQKLYNYQHYSLNQTRISYMTIINNTTITTNYNANASLYTLTKAAKLLC